MKKILRIFFMLMVFEVALLGKQVVTMAIGDWAPYTSSSEINGKMAEIIVSEAFSLENINVQYEYYPWKRAITLVKWGDKMGTFPWYKTKQREHEYIISKESIVTSKTVFFHLKSLDFKWNDYEDLKKYKIGGTIGYSDSKRLKNNGVKVEEVPREDMNFKKILANRIDLTISSFYVGYNIINKLFSPQMAALFTNHPKAVLDEEMYMFISRNIPNAQELSDTFDKGLLKLKKSGRYDAIIFEFMSK